MENKKSTLGEEIIHNLSLSSDDGDEFEIIDGNDLESSPEP